MTVLVSGATGTTGTEVLRQLRAAGAPVRALTRHEAAAQRLLKAGIDVVVADLTDPDSLPAALDGIKAVYLATSASPELPQLESNLATCAAQAGVGHLVKLSVIGASANSTITFSRLHDAAEQAIRRSGMPWTMVRPNGFMQNTLAWSAQVADGAIRGPVIDARWSIVDVRDVAAVAFAALLDPEAHAGETYTVTGPEATSPREQVEILAEVLGRPLLAQEVSIDQAKQGMLAGGWRAWSAERMGELFGFYADGLGETISPDVQRVTGARARDYRTFATDHAESFGAA